MKSSDTLLNYVFRVVESHNALIENKITPLQALKIYHDIIKPRHTLHNAPGRARTG